MNIYRNIRGEFGYRSALFVPSMVGGYLTYLGPEKVIDLFETTIFQCVSWLSRYYKITLNKYLKYLSTSQIYFFQTFEHFFIMRKNILSRTIANSRLIQTYLFMLCSSVILHAKRLYNTKGFWILTPNPQIHNKENTEEFEKCELHPETSCKQYLISGMRKYFILGLSLDLIKMLMSHVNLKQNQSKFVGKLKNFRIRSMALLSAYIGIYRVSEYISVI